MEFSLKKASFYPGISRRLLHVPEISLRKIHLISPFPFANLLKKIYRGEAPLTDQRSTIYYLLEIMAIGKSVYPFLTHAAFD